MHDDMEMRNEFVGKTYTRLRVVDVLRTGVRSLRLLCVCTCGAQCEAAAHQLRSGDKKSCGCLKRSVLADSTRTHGRSNSRLTGYADRTYGVWQAMHDRCTNANRKDWHCYGGKGIKVCRRWYEFENFLVDMGNAPAGLTLDRIDGDRGYSPSNCRWASRKEQTRNSSRMLWIEYEGETHCVGDWVKKLGVRTNTYYGRLRLGWSRKEALGLQERKHNDEN